MCIFFLFQIAEDEDKSAYLPYYGESHNSSDIMYDECQMYADPANHSAGTTQCQVDSFINSNGGFPLIEFRLHMKFLIKHILMIILYQDRLRKLVIMFFFISIKK